MCYLFVRKVQNFKPLTIRKAYILADSAEKDDNLKQNSDPNVKSNEVLVNRHNYRNSSTDTATSRVINSLIKHQNISIENDLKKYYAHETPQ